jgi:uncharacterized protein
MLSESKNREADEMFSPRRCKASRRPLASRTGDLATSGRQWPRIAWWILLLPLGCSQALVSAPPPSGCVSAPSAVEEEEGQLESLVYTRQEGYGCSAKRVQQLEARCAEGRRSACFAAATQYRQGCGVEHGRGGEEKLYGAACRLGSRVGCELEATAISDHGGDPARALALLEATCNRGYAPACGHLGLLLWMSKRDKEAIARGVGLIERACLSGGRGLHYCSRLGTIVGENRDRGHFDKVSSLLSTACEWGYLDSCYVLGIALEDGTLGVCNAVEAARLQGAGCEQGYLMSCNALGYMYAKGNGRPKDPVAAYDIFARACQKRFVAACDSVAEAIEKG